MIIKEFTIENYKCFHKPQTLHFDRGFNVIVGKNNAGKSALVRAMKQEGENAPHKSVNTMHMLGAQSAAHTRTQIRYEVGKDEFAKILLAAKTSFCFPPKEWVGEGTYDNVCMEVFGRPQWQFEYGNSGTGLPPSNVCIDFDVYPILLPKSEAGLRIEAGLLIEPQSDGSLKAVGNIDNSRRSTPSYESFFTSVLHDSIYAFDAVRGNPHDKQANSNVVLAPDASNLAFVFRNMQGNLDNRARYDEAVSTVFPHLGVVTFVDEPPASLQIMVHRAGMSDDRPDLAIPLSACGTGITQVLAMLYVVVTAREPRIIIIDEPNSFLHPEAVRNLIEVLKSYPQHQYILTTHSPAVIAACDPATLTEIKQTEGASDFLQMDANDRKDQARVLIAVGADMSDVFGSDNILWVEGQTEVSAFPLIIKRFKIAPPSRLTILPVRGTSDFNMKRIEIVSDIHDRLSKGDSLLPKTVNFLFDSENLPEDEKKKRTAKVPILHFLPRRMYENYLLHPEAITFIANSAGETFDTPIILHVVQDWLEKHSQEEKYYANPKRRKPDWHEDVDGAELLTDLFAALFEAKYSYQKTRDSVALTTWLLANDKEALREVANLLEDILTPASQTPNSQRKESLANY